MDLEFGKWRRWLWPIHRSELVKFLPLFFIKFLVALIYTFLYNAKDTVIVTSKGAGAEAIPILKGYLVLPMAFLVMLIYSKLSNILSKPGLFYATLSPFVLFFAIYGFYLYPYQDSLCPHKSADWLLSQLGEHRAHWVAIYRYWMHSAFYVFADLWGTVVINLLFWTFANQINNINEAKRFYTLFSAAGDFGTLISGPLIWYSIPLPQKLDFGYLIQTLMGLSVCLSLLTMLIYAWVNKYVLTHKSEANKTDLQKASKKKTKLSLKDSLLYIAKSSYLRHIAFMVIGYALTLNLVEVCWKATLQVSYPNPQDYYSFMSVFSFWTGLVSLLVTVFMGGSFIRGFGWYKGAQITPVLVCLSGLVFFFLYFSQEAPFMNSWGLSPILIVAYYGAFQNILSKAAKYSFFDPTKEMAYIPLDPEAKIKGKAAVDVVGSRFGKSGSSWLQSIMIDLSGTGSVLGIAHYIAPLILTMTSYWMYSVHVLNKQFHRLKSVPKDA